MRKGVLVDKFAEMALFDAVENQKVISQASERQAEQRAQMRRALDEQVRLKQEAIVKEREADKLWVAKEQHRIKIWNEASEPSCPLSSGRDCLLTHARARSRVLLLSFPHAPPSLSRSHPRYRSASHPPSPSPSTFPSPSHSASPFPVRLHPPPLALSLFLLVSFPSPARLPSLPLATSRPLLPPLARVPLAQHRMPTLLVTHFHPPNPLLAPTLPPSLSLL